MAHSFELAAAFLKAHPAEAARVLESLPTREACEFFALAEPVPGAGALSAMLPTAAARILTNLPEPHAVSLATAASTQSAVAILRHIPAALRTRLIAGMPAATAIAMQMLLGFPDDTVGAWTDTEIVAVPSTANVAAVLDQLRAMPEAAIEQIFVVDAAQHLQGCVGLHTLLKADSRALIGTLARPAVATLASMMTLSSLRGAAHWERAQSLPVLDREQRLIGVLRRVSLTRARRSRSRTPIPDRQTASLTGTLASSYWGIVSGLSSATLAVLPTVGRVLPDDA